MFCITETPQILLHYPTWEAFVRLKGRHLARPSPPAFLTIAHPSGLCQALEFPPHFKIERAVCRTLTSHFHDLLVRALLTRSLLVINITQDPSYRMRKYGTNKGGTKTRVLEALGTPPSKIPKLASRNVLLLFY